MIRELMSAYYQKTMNTEIKDGSNMNVFLKVLIWISCAFLYCCEAAQVFFRLANHAPTDAAAIIGTVTRNPFRICIVYIMFGGASRLFFMTIYKHKKAGILP